MPRHAPELECSAEDKASLVAITKSRIEEARVVERARIVLACVDGKEIQQVARELAVSIPTVTKWRRRFALWGLRGLGDQPRSGKPVRYDTTFRNRVLAVLEEPPPPGMSHWDGPAVAEKLDASVHAVWRVLRREGIYLQRRRSWCVSTDKEFAPKAADVVGLYLNPPLNAVVLSVDEKPSIQAIERASGYVETDSGKVVRGLEHFDFPSLRPVIDEIRQEIEDGRGFVVLRRLPVEDYSKDEIGMIFWGIGTYLGRGLSQSVLGDRLGHVKDFSREDPLARAYRNKQELSPHTDSCDLVGLACLRDARSGGVSR